jgi:hypothetical protein
MLRWQFLQHRKRPSGHIRIPRRCEGAVELLTNIAISNSSATKPDYLRAFLNDLFG